MPFLDACRPSLETCLPPAGETGDLLHWVLR